PRELHRRPQFRPSGICGGGHLRHLPALTGPRRDDQPPAAGRSHGVRALARSDLHRAAAARPAAAARRAVEIDAEYRDLVESPEALLERYLHEQIPLSAAMGLRARVATSECVQLVAPLGPNVNHNDTIFGGSAAA